MITAPELVTALHNADILITSQGDALEIDAPKGAVTPPLAAALRLHKPMLLAVMRTLTDRSRDADWDCVRAWMLDDTKTFTPTVQAAARRMYLPVHKDEWPEAYARRFRGTLRVRGLLAAFSDQPTRTSEPPAHCSTPTARGAPA